jgi:hypothetical protein
MKIFKSKYILMIGMSLFLVTVYGCDNASEKTGAVQANMQESVQAEQAGGEQGEHTGEPAGEHAEEGEREEHEGEARGEHGGEGEEAGPRLALDDTHDEVRKGVRLIISFDSDSSSFIGTVENITDKTLSGVRVEVHLSNGVELGPTMPIDGYGPHY